MQALTAANARVAEDAGHARRIRAILAGSAGNLIEWYNFYVYALTALYFSPLFFPRADRVAQVMATSGIFAVSFLFRPIGGWYFGRLADRRGRRAAMVASVLVMGAGSLLIAVLPTYAQAGIAAPLLLLLGRILQGFSTGGQYGTAATYLSEAAISGQRGFYSSFQYVTLIGGELLATLVIVVLQNVLSAAGMRDYGWRIGFAIGAAAALAMLVLRHQMHETTRAEQRGQNAGSVRELMRHLPAAFTVLGLTAGGSLSFYTFTTYMQKYLVLTAGFSRETATTLMAGVLIVFMIAQPLAGRSADRIGRRNNLIIFGALATLCTWPILAAVGRAGVWGAFLLIAAGMLINSFYSSISGLFKAELFPVHVRALGVGLVYGIGNALFGGTAENVALAFKDAGHESYFYFYVTALCAVSLLTALLMRDTRRDNPLDSIRV